MNLSQDIFFELYSIAITETEIADILDKKMITDSLIIFMEIANKAILADVMLDDPEIKHNMALLKELVDDDYRFSDIQRLTLITSKYITLFPDKKDKLYGSFLTSILLAKEDLSEGKLDRSYKKLRNLIAIDKINKDLSILNTKTKRLKNSNDLLSQEILINEILQKGKSLTEDLGVLTKPMINSTAEFIDFTSRESIIDALRVNRMTRESTKFQTGLTGLNELLHKDLELGETVLIGGITHNYKSGMLMDFARWIANNDPPKLDNLKPMILFLSLENEAYKNLLSWYKRSYFIETGMDPDPKTTDEQIADFIKDYFGKRGWAFHIQRKIGDFFGVDELIKLLEEYRNKGYRVYSVILDYFTLMKVGDYSSPNNSLATRALLYQTAFRKVRTLCKHDNILFITAGQLNDGASEVARNTTKAVTNFSYHNHFAVSKGLAHEADCIIFVHKELNNMKQPFLTMAWAKRRDKNPPTPDKMYCAYPFHRERGIIDDLYSPKPGYIKDIYNVIECSNLFGAIDKPNNEDDIYS